MSWRDQVQQENVIEQPPRQESWRDQVEETNLATLPSAQRFSNLGKTETYEAADFLTRVRAELVDDENLKREIYAEAKGVSPDSVNLEGEEKGTLKQLGAELLAHGPSVGLSVAGATGAGPFGAFVGGAGGEGWRKVLGNMLEGEKQTSQGNINSMAAEGALATAGDTGGRLVGKGLDKLSSRRAVRDISELNDFAVNHMQTMARDYGITLTPGEASGLNSLINRQWLLSTLPDSSNVIQSFLKRREADIEKAVFNYFEHLSTAKSPFHAALEGKRTYQAAREQLVEKRTEATEELYRNVWRQGTKVDAGEVKQLRQTLLDLVNDGNLSQRSTINWVNKNIGEEPATLKKLHNAKIAIDKRLESLRDKTMSADKADRATLQKAKEEILNLIETHSPEYGIARAKFKEMSSPLDALDNSIAAGFLKVDDIKAIGVAKQIFSSQSSPEAVGEAMHILRHADPGGADAVIRAHLEDAFGRIKDLQVDAPQNLGGQFRKAVFSSRKEREMLKAAMSEENWRNFNDLMKVLDATSRAFRGNSITTPAGVMLSDLKSEALYGGSRVARLAVSGIDTAANPLQGGKQFLGWIRDNYERMRMGEYSENLARAMVDPYSMRALRQQTDLLTQENLSRRQALAAVGAVFAILLGPEISQSEDQQSSRSELEQRLQEELGQ